MKEMDYLTNETGTGVGNKDFWDITWIIRLKKLTVNNNLSSKLINI